MVQHTAFENIDVIPANIDLSAAEVQLVTEVGREQILNSVLRKLKSEYDLIIVDCQPSLGLLTVNALAAADGVIIPVAAEFFDNGIAVLMCQLGNSSSDISQKTPRLSCFNTAQQTLLGDCNQICSRLSNLANHKHTGCI